MNIYFGIYGYAITRETKLNDNLNLYPLFSNYQDVTKLSKDENLFHLTAILVYQINSSSNFPGGYIIYDNELLFELAGILTFVEQRWVEINGPVYSDGTITLEQLAAKFPKSLNFSVKRTTSGSFILDDAFEPDSKRNLINLCLTRLRDASFENQTNFKSAFFRDVEIIRLYPSFIDVEYYLSFSALEILSRKSINDYVSPIEGILARYLQNFGFDVRQHYTGDRVKSINTYCRLRNELFHNGRHQVTFNENNNQITLHLGDYYHKLKMILPYVILKVLGFDDGNINWNAWYDRMPFI